jgi:hypothetical protein
MKSLAWDGVHGKCRAKDGNEMDRVLLNEAARHPPVRLWSVDPHAVSAREYNLTPDSHSMPGTKTRMQVSGSVSLQTLRVSGFKVLEGSDVQLKEPVPT